MVSSYARPNKIALTKNVEQRNFSFWSMEDTETKLLKNMCRSVTYNTSLEALDLL